MRALLEALTAIGDDGVVTGGGDEDIEMQESRSEREVEKEDENEKEGEAEKIDVAPSRFRTWQGLQNVPTGPANPRLAPTQPRSPYQTGLPSRTYLPYPAYQPRPTPLTPGPPSSYHPSPYQASPAAPPAMPAPPAASPSGLLANPSTGPSLPQQPQGAVLGKSKIQKSEKPKTEKKKKDAEKKKREAERLEREKKREEKERREEEERREMREEEREERRREREEERRRDEERRREERERGDRRHRQFLDMMAAQETARSAEAVRQEAARSAEAARQKASRATQAERERTLASLSTLGAAAEQRFVSLRNGYLEARGRETHEHMWRQYNLAVNICDRVLSQIYNWRSSVVAEVGSTPESALSVRLSAIENEASIVLREAPRITAPTPAPHPSLLPGPP